MTITKEPKKSSPVPGRILGIDGGSRWIGWAVLDQGAPSYWGTIDCGVERGGPGATQRRVRTVIGRLLQDLRPEVVVIEEPTNDNTARMKPLRQVLREIVRLVDASGARRVFISPKTARFRVCRNGWATKEEVATTLAQRFPELTYWLRPRKSKQLARYAHHSSDAMCCALAVAHREIEK